MGYIAIQEKSDEIVCYIEIIGDTLYGIKYNSNQLFRMNIYTGQAEYICGIKNMDSFKNNKRILIRACGDYIYYLPSACNMIYRYSIGGNEFSFISYLKGQDFRKNSYLIMEPFDNYMYVFFTYDMGICKFSDTLTRVECPEYDKINKEEITSFRVGNKVYLIEYITGLVWTFDLETEELVCLENAPSIIGAGGIIYYQGFAYIVFDDNSMMIWNLNTGEYNRIQNQNILKKMPSSSFSYLVPAGNKMYLLPALANDILVAERGKEFEIYDDYPKDYCYIRDEGWLKKGSKFVFMCETDSDYVFPMIAANYMMIISKSSGIIRWIKPFFDETHTFYSSMEVSGMILEKELPLTAFIDHVVIDVYR